MDVLEGRFCHQSDTEPEYSDDSSDDSSFDVLEETRLTFSNLSIKRKPKIRIIKEADEKEGEDSAATETVVQELDEQSQKNYETVQKIIEDGQVERLKVEQCKIYLRKHGLRLSGTKEILIRRIKEHIRIVNGGGEEKYPPSSFVMNCKGDACMGDVVTFEQTVYEGFNIASRRANGPPCGTRVVAGRIVKESYGAAKQQHTFTIEVLWSKGEKPLPPLHQLLIKGRNLYRLKTMRQRWDDEEERHKILREKHDRGGVARLNREARVQQREMRNMHKQARSARNERQNTKPEEEKRKTMSITPVMPEKVEQPKLQQQDPRNAQKQQNCYQRTHGYSSSCNNVPIQPQDFQEKRYGIAKPLALPLESPLQRQPLISINHHFHRDKHARVEFNNFDSTMIPSRGGFIGHHTSSQLHGFANTGHPSYSQHCHDAFYQQTCRHYIRGRCNYGDRCKFLHEVAGNNM